MLGIEPQTKPTTRVEVPIGQRANLPNLFIKCIWQSYGDNDGGFVIIQTFLLKSSYTYSLPTYMDVSFPIKIVHFLTVHETWCYFSSLFKSS